jgi:hypothetical protein
VQSEHTALGKALLLIPSQGVAMTTTTAPSAPSQNPFASVTTLGNLLSYHEKRVVSSQGRMKIANVSLVFGIALFVFGGILMLQDNGNALCLVLPGVAFVGLGLLGWWDARQSRDLRVGIFEQGIALSEKQGLQSMRWEEVARAFQILTREGNTTIIRHGYRLENASGQKLWWNDDVSNAPHAWELVRRHLYPRLMQSISTAFNRGDTVAFGELSANRDGLSQKNKLIPWAGIEDVQVANGTLTIKGEQNGKKEEFRTLWSVTPNADLLLNLIEQMRGK